MAKTWLKHEVRIVIHPLFWGNRVAFILHLDDWTWWSQTWLKMYILRPKFQKGNLCFFPSSSAVLSLVLNMFSLKKNQSLIDKPSKGNYPKKWVKWTLDEFPQHFPPRFTTAQQPRRKVCQRNPSVDGLGASGAPENAVKQWLGIDYPLVQDGLIWFNIV